MESTNFYYFLALKREDAIKSNESQIYRRFLKSFLMNFVEQMSHSLNIF